MTCAHDLAERETACADGMCPICSAKDNERLRAEVAALREDAERIDWLASQSEDWTYKGQEALSFRWASIMSLREAIDNAREGK